MHDSICLLVNEHFYGGQLDTVVDSKRIEAEKLAPLPGRPVVLVELKSEDGSHVELSKGGSRFNRGSARLCVSLAKYYVTRNKSIRVGIITPYRAQVGEVRRLIKDCKFSRATSDRILVGTVHAFQGSEADVVIWDLVDSPERGIGRPYRGDTGDRLVNVAISRARGKLIVVGDPHGILGTHGAAQTRKMRDVFQQAFSESSRNVILASEVEVLWDRTPKIMSRLAGA